MRLDGVHVPIITPFTAEGELNLGVLSDVARFLVGHKVAGIVVAGTTGEGYSLTMDERSEVTSTVKATVDGDCLVLVGVGGMTTSQAIDQAEQAATLGADGLMLAAPAYVRPTPHELAAHVRSVVRQVALPTVLYDYPARTGTSYDHDALVELSDVPEVVGIKEASGDTSRIGWLLRDVPQIALVSGNDACELEFLGAGSLSWIAGGANVFPSQHADVVRLWRDGDQQASGELLEALLPFLQSIEDGYYVAKVKYALRAQGMDVGPTRPPLLTLPDQERVQFDDVLAKVAKALGNR